MRTDGTLIRAEEGPKVLASPPRAYMAQAFFSLDMAVYTLGGYNWRHRGDFSIFTFKPLKGPNLDQNLRKKNCSIFRAFGVVWRGSRWKLKNRHGGAICILLKCQPPLQVWELIEPYEM